MQVGVRAGPRLINAEKSTKYSESYYYFQNDSLSEYDYMQQEMFYQEKTNITDFFISSVSSVQSVVSLFPFSLIRVISGSIVSLPAAWNPPTYYIQNCTIRFIKLFLPMLVAMRKLVINLIESASGGQNSWSNGL